MTSDNCCEIEFEITEQVIEFDVDGIEVVISPLGEVGPEGPPGPAGDAIAAIPFSFGDAASVVATAPHDGVLTAVRLDITTAFNGDTPTIKVGIIGDIESLMPAIANDPTIVAAFENTADLAVTAGTGIWLQIDPGAGASQGAGVLFISFVPE